MYIFFYLTGVLDFEVTVKQVKLTSNQEVSCVSFTILNDEEVEDSEDFLVTFGIDGSLNVLRGNQNTTTVTIIDNDGRFGLHIFQY